MRPQGTAIELERRRRLAVQRIVDGYSTQEVATFLGVDPSSVRRWVAAFRHEGCQGLVARAVPGRPPKLSRTQEKIVLRWLTDNPIEHGFATELWTCQRLAQLIEEEFGVRFHPAYLSVWLRARHQTPQKPQRAARERDPERMARWLAIEWPRIKKKPSVGERIWPSSMKAAC
jgi:transposase